MKTRYGFDRIDKLTRQANYKLVLILSPQGNRKTTLLQEWIARRQESGRPAIRINLAPADNLPTHFLATLDTALEKAFPIADDATEFQEIVLDGSSGIEEALIERINRLVEAPEGFTLIFDGYQVITSPEIHSAVQLMLDYLPPQVQLIIATSSEPPLQLPRLRVRRQLLEILLEDLDG